jgi:hypothetical protein
VVVMSATPRSDTESAQGLIAGHRIMDGLQGATERVRGGVPETLSSELERLRKEARKLADQEAHLHPQTQARLESMVRYLDQTQAEPVEVPFETLAQWRAVLVKEREQHELWLAQVARDTKTELRLTVSLLVALPLAGGVLLLLRRSRIKHPLEDLRGLLERFGGAGLPRGERARYGRFGHRAKPAFWRCFDSWSVRDQ